MIKGDPENSYGCESDIADADDNSNGLPKNEKDTAKKREKKGGSTGPIKDVDGTTTGDAYTQIDGERKRTEIENKGSIAGPIENKDLKIKGEGDMQHIDETRITETSSNETRRSSEYDMCDVDDITNQKRPERDEYKLVVEALQEFIKHHRGDTVIPTHQDGTEPDALQTNSTTDPTLIIQLKRLFQEHNKATCMSVLEADLDQTKNHNESLEKMHKDLLDFVTRTCDQRDTTSRDCSGNPEAREDNKYDIVSVISWHYHQQQQELDKYKQEAHQLKSREHFNKAQKKLKDTNIDLKREIDKQKKEIDKQKREIDKQKRELKQEIDRHKGTVKQLEGQKKANVELAAKQIGLQTFNHSQGEEIEAIKLALKEAYTHIDYYVTEGKQFTSNINYLNGTVREMSCQIHQQTLQSQSKDNSIEQLQRNIVTLEEKCSSLTLRLSKIAGAHLTRNNPNITDLSDINRPTKLAEKYSELYDNEWTDAYEECTDNWNMDEETCLKTMLDLLKTANDECVQLLQPHRDILKTLTMVTVKLDKPAVKQDLHIEPDTSNCTEDKSSHTDKLFGEAEDKTKECDSTGESLQVNDNGLTTQEPKTDDTEEPMDIQINNTPEKITEKIIEVSGRSIDNQCHSPCSTETTEEQDIHANDQIQEEPESANMTGNQDTTEGQTKDKEQRNDMLYRQSQDKLVSLVGDLPFESNVETRDITTEIKVTDEFTEEQKKAVSDMRKLCGVKLEQEGEISKIIAKKIAIERGIDIKSSDNMMTYITKCAQLCWYMAIQEPPVVIGFQETTEDGHFDKDVYKPYTKVGKKLDFFVWPPLYLHKNDGPMLCKGTAQGKD